MKKQQFTIRYTPPGSKLPVHVSATARTPRQAVDSVLPPEDIAIVFQAKPGTSSRSFVSVEGYTGEVVPHIGTPAL